MTVLDTINEIYNISDPSNDATGRRFVNVNAYAVLKSGMVDVLRQSMGAYTKGVHLKITRVVVREYYCEVEVRVERADRPAFTWWVEAEHILKVSYEKPTPQSKFWE